MGMNTFARHCNRLQETHVLTDFNMRFVFVQKLVAAVKCICMEVFLRLKDLHAYGKICESVHKTASANKICKRKRSFAKV